MHRLSRQSIPVKLRPQPDVPIDHCTTGRCEPIRRAKVVVPVKRRAARKHRGRTWHRRHLLSNARQTRMRIPLHITLLQTILPDRIRVVIAEPVAEIIPLTPKLRRPGDTLRSIRVRLNSEIPTTQQHRCTRRTTATGIRYPRYRSQTRHQTSAVAIRQIQPTVQPPPQTIHSVLLIAFHKSRVQRLPQISHPITIPILGIQNLRRHRDQHTTPPALNPVREIQSVKKCHRSVIHKIPVNILQNSHSPGLTTTRRIVPHLHHPQPPTLVPVKSHRIPDQRLCSRQHDTQPGTSMQDGTRFLRTLRSRELCLQRIGIKMPRQLLLHSVTYQIFRLRSQAGRTPIIQHRRIHFITALPQQTRRSNITRHIVAVGIHPQPTAIKHFIQPDAVVHNDFTTQKHHRQILAKTPRLHRVVRYSRRYRLTSFQQAQKMPRPRTRHPRLPGLRLQLLLRRYTPQRQINPTELRRNPTTDSIHCASRAQYSLHFLRQSLTVHASLLMSAPRRRIRIRTATNRHQRDSSRDLRLQHVGRKPCPVPTDLIEFPGLRRAVTGIVHQQSNNLPTRVPCSQQRHAFVHRTIRNLTKSRPTPLLQSPSVHGKTRLTIPQMK